MSIVQVSGFRVLVGGGDEWPRIDGLSVAVDLVVDVWAGGVSGAPGVTDGVVLSDFLAQDHTSEVD